MTRTPNRLFTEAHFIDYRLQKAQAKRLGFFVWPLKHLNPKIAASESDLEGSKGRTKEARRGLRAPYSQVSDRRRSKENGAAPSTFLAGQIGDWYGIIGGVLAVLAAH